MKDRKKFIIDFAYYACWIIIVYVGFTYFLPIILPFLFGYLFSMTAHRILRNQSTVALILLYIVIGLILTFIGIYLVNQAGAFVATVPTLYENTIRPYINTAYNNLMHLTDQFDFPYINEILTSGLDAIKNILLSLGSSAASAISRGITNIPTVLISVLTFVVSSFFITADYENVNGFIRRHFEAPYSYVMNKLVVILGGYVKIMAITFVELTIGFMIMGEHTPILVAMAIAFVDILPVLGCGTVLIPWGVIALLSGDLRGIGILILYGVITIIRQYIEPKIVGNSLEISPIVSLMSMVIGLRLFGFSGMLGMPIIMSYLGYVAREKEAEAQPKTDTPANSENTEKTESAA